VLPAVEAPAVEAPAVEAPAVEVASPLVAGAPVPVAPAVEAPSAEVEVAEESVLIVLLDSVVAGVVVVLSVVEAVLDSQEVKATARNRADTFRRLFIL
jgi:DNA polymerase IIIc chi subunit